ncbi:MAG: hypothetical protein DRJ57_02835 [Thermoprotei archaeon]|nr:MAG: hypothetical protein DRJ57_02835 [Thermoprotei archaeon]
MRTVSAVHVTLKVFPPFTSKPHTVERRYALPEDSRLIDVLRAAQSEGLLDLGRVVGEDSEVREGAVILVNGRAVFNADYELHGNDRVVVLPLAPGG